MIKQLAVGTKVARFEVQDEVGRGGMGVVYRCFDPVLKRSIALKLLASHLGHNPTALARFQREATLVASLKHAHIASVYDFGEYEGQPYIALEWIEGQTLKELLHAPEPLSLARCLHFFDQLASALDYAHQRGVIHRDLKPANIIIGPDDLVTIVDFGIAWLDAEPSITTTGSVVGTPLYMSPEQIQGKALDGRSDLYSLAVIVYQMLAGQPPFDNDTPAALFQQLIHAPPPPISEHNPTLPPAIEPALKKALAKNRDERFPDGASMGRALHGLTKLSAAQGKKRRLLPLILAGGILFWLVVVFMMLYGPSLYGPSASSSSEASAFNNNEANPSSLPTEAVLVSDESEQSPVNEEAEEAESALQDEEFDENVEEEGGVWLMAGGNPFQNRAVDAPFVPLHPEPRWHHEVEATGSLVGTFNQLIVGQGAEVITLYGENGEETQDPILLSTQIVAAPAVYINEEDSVLVVPTEEGELYAFNLADGRLRWHLRADELVGSLPSGVTTAYDDTFYAATTEGHVYALELFGKDILWSLDLSEQDRFIQPPSIVNVALFLASQERAVLAIDLAAHTEVWRTETDGVPVTPPIASESTGLVIVATNEGWVQAFSMLSGAEVWRYPAESDIFGLAMDWDFAYLVTEQQELIVLEATSGELMWETLLDQPIIDAPITNGEMLMVATEEEVRFFNAYEGEEVTDMRLSVPGSILDSPIWLGEWLFVQTTEGIYGFSPQEESE